MDSALVQPYEHLVQMLSVYAASMLTSQPADRQAAWWLRASTYLDRELRLVQALRGSYQAVPAQLKSAATRLTQLAHSQDGLRLELSAAIPAGQLMEERRLVVFAAWQLLQAVEHADALQPETISK